MGWNDHYLDAGEDDLKETDGYFYECISGGCTKVFTSLDTAKFWKRQHPEYEVWLVMGNGDRAKL